MRIRQTFRMIAAVASGFVATAGAQLSVVNGDFSDLTGMSAFDNGWYSGVPYGWSGTANTYSVSAGNGNPQPAVNLDGVGTLRQYVGTNTFTATVTLAFDIGTFNSAPSVTVRITDGATVLASASCAVGAGQTLAAYVPAYMPVYIEFLKAGGGSPYVDNVSVSSADAPLTVINGDFSDVTGLTTPEGGGNWRSGVPARWSSTSGSPVNTVDVGQGSPPPVANLQHLSALSQTAGTVKYKSDLTLTFDFSEPWNSPCALSALILTNSAVMVSNSFTSVGTKTVAASDVPVGASITFLFVNDTPATAPGLDNVSVSVSFAASEEPIITSQPSALSAMVQGTVRRLSVGAVGVSPLGYQWRHNGGTLADATNAALTVSNAGTYDVVVTGGNGLSVTSAVANVVAGVINGDFSDLTGMTPDPDPQHSGWYTGLPFGWTSTEHPTGDFYAVSTLFGPTPPTCNPSTLTYLRQAVGTLTNASHVVLTFDVPDAFPHASPHKIGATILGTAMNALATKEYGTGMGRYVVATNVAAGTALTIEFWAVAVYPGLDNVAVTVYALDAPPAITRQPQASVALPEPLSATLSVSATGVPPISYQWRADGADLAGATNADLTVVRPGDYSVAVTAATQTSVTSEVSRVFLTNALPVLNGDFTSDHLASGWNSAWSRLGPPSATSGWNESAHDGTLNLDRFGVWAAFLSVYTPTYALERSVTAQSKIRVSFKAGYADQGGSTVYVDLIVGGTTNTREFAIGQALETYTAVFDTEQQTGAVTLRFRGGGTFVTDVGSVLVTRLRPGTFLMLL